MYLPLEFRLDSLGQLSYSDETKRYINQTGKQVTNAYQDEKRINNNSLKLEPTKLIESKILSGINL